MEPTKPDSRLTRRSFIQNTGVAVSGFVFFPLSGSVFNSMDFSGTETSLLNPTPHDFRNEPVRLKVLPPGPAGSFRIMNGNTEIPYQTEETDGKPYIWVCADFQADSQQQFQIIPGRAAKFPPLVSIKNDGEFFILENENISVKIPARAVGNIPGPVAGIKLADGAWAGNSFWKTKKTLKKYSATVIGNGTIFAKIRLRYDFDGMAGPNNDIPAFSEMDIRLDPQSKHVSIFERHEMGSEDYWEFEMSHGWSPVKGISKPFNNGPGGDGNYHVPPTERPLVPIENVSFSPELFINLVPRWNQHFKDGWAFAASDGNRQLSAVAVKASKWKWPHDNNLQCVVKPEGNYAGVRCSAWHGQRLWWLSSFPEPMDISYISKNIWENIDKINHDYILKWPGKSVKWWSINPYDSEQINPTHNIRRIGKEVLKNAGQPADETTLIRFQTLIHNDCWGSYRDFFSPENPNFFTDFNLVPIALATNLKEHPQFETFRKLAENKFRDDIYHSVTLPGGAGQECPGYSHYGMSLWRKIAEMGEKHLDFEMKFINQRLDASEKFYQRISYPNGEIRRGSPVGDSHPDRDGKTGMPKVDVDNNIVRKWKTEELPGFGVIFNNRPGTENETYLSFKSGPNRCHYHGDQLSFHYCANSRPLVVDHHCSYNPRAGQEHMHNRLAFFTSEMPFANMDGYERILAFKTSESVDIAVGQVESNRLRKVEPLPPETWDARYPQLKFDEPLIYRRTVVFMKNGVQDYFVFRDQFWADRQIGAALCFHTYGEEAVRKGNQIDFGKLSLFCTHPDFSMKNFNWSHENGGHEETKGVRLEIAGQTGEMITVIYPGNAQPNIRIIPGGVQVGDDTIVFGGINPDVEGTQEIVKVSRPGRNLISLNGDKIDFNRSQGEIGLFVPDAGYPFGEIPGWLARQRATKPDWIKE
ncbi:MAG: hypothetical protein EP310_05795 [Bacteroidetes bacterium]|nr:MAG: hypothetical protein EP310_05795 [Bacteroidota bacterium]